MKHGRDDGRHMLFIVIICPALRVSRSAWSASYAPAVNCALFFNYNIWYFLSSHFPAEIELAPLFANIVASWISLIGGDSSSKEICTRGSIYGNDLGVLLLQMFP